MLFLSHPHLLLLTRFARRSSLDPPSPAPHRACPECLATVKEKLFDKHMETDCPRRRKMCHHNNCGEMVPLDRLKDHEDRLCPVMLNRNFIAQGAKKLIKCPAGCGKYVKLASIPHHNKEQCANRIVECSVMGCAERMPFHEIEKHETLWEMLHEQGTGIDYFQSTVTGETSWDPMGCETKRVRHALCELYKLHDEIVPCSRGCGEEVRRVDLQAHEDGVCELRPVRCRNEGCEESEIRYCDRAEHELETCPMAVVRGELAEKGRLQRELVACPRGCDELVARRHKWRHQSEECRFRLVHCKHACGERIPLPELWEHETEICEKRIRHRAMANRSRLRKGGEAMPWEIE